LSKAKKADLLQILVGAMFIERRARADIALGAMTPGQDY
jgi:hypothetical protein